MPSSDRWEPARLSIYLYKVGSLSPPSTLDECGLLRKMLEGFEDEDAVITVGKGHLGSRDMQNWRDVHRENRQTIRDQNVFFSFCQVYDVAKVAIIPRQI
jgi:hypothetical protein